MLDRHGRPVQPQRMGAVQQNAAADPQHGRGADHRQGAHHHRHAFDQTPPQGANATVGPLGQAQTDIVHLHDQADRAIDDDGHGDADHGKHGGLGQDRLRRHIGQGDGHDLGRQDQVGAHGARHRRLLQRRRIARDWRGILMPAMPYRLQQLFGSLETQIGPAAHQDRRDGPGREGAEHQGHRQDEDQLVAKRPQRDLADDRQFAAGRQAHDIARRDRRIVHHHASGLGRGLAGRRAHVIQRRGRQLCNAGDVVQQCDQSRRHSQSSRLGGTLTPCDFR